MAPRRRRVKSAEAVRLGPVRTRTVQVGTVRSWILRTVQVGTVRSWILRTVQVGTVRSWILRSVQGGAVRDGALGVAAVRAGTELPGVLQVGRAVLVGGAEHDRGPGRHPRAGPDLLQQVLQ